MELILGIFYWWQVRNRPNLQNSCFSNNRPNRIYSVRARTGIKYL